MHIYIATSGYLYIFRYRYNNDTPKYSEINLDENGTCKKLHLHQIASFLEYRAYRNLSFV